MYSQICREAGAFQQWTKEQSDDPVFKAYGKEYKKRFAWIKAGRISDTDFYAWSEHAREMKKKCDRDIITPEEYVEWLKNSWTTDKKEYGTGLTKAGPVFFV